MGKITDVLQCSENSKDLYTSLRPLLHFSSLVGITSFRIKDRKLRPSFLGFLNAVLHLIVFAFSFLMSLINGETLVGYFFKSNISKVGDTMLKFSGLFGMTITYVICLTRRRSIQRLVSTIEEIDKKLIEMQIEVDYSKYYKRSIITLTIVVILNTVYIFGCLELLNSIGVSSSFTANITFFSPLLVISIMVSMFICIIAILELRFRIIKKVLKGLTERVVGKYTSVLKVENARNHGCAFVIQTSALKTPSEIIEDAMQIHSLLYETASTANKYFTYQLLTIISIAFLIIVFDAYYILETILGHPRREIQFNTAEFVAFFSCQMVLHVLAVCAIVEGGSKTIAESEKIAIRVYKLMNKTKDNDLREKLSYFSMQLVHEKIRFTAAGLFNIDRTLYFTISGAATTYLIILLQFTSSGQPDYSIFSGMNNTQK